MRQLLARVLPKEWASYVLHLRLAGAPIVVCHRLPSHRQATRLTW